MSEKYINVVEVNLPGGATPLTMADVITRECADREWLEDVIFFLQAYVSRTYGGGEE